MISVYLETMNKQRNNQMMTKVFLKWYPMNCENDSLYLKKKRFEEFRDLLKCSP